MFTVTPLLLPTLIVNLLSSKSITKKGLHTNWMKLSFFETDSKMRIPHRTVQLWRVFNDDLKTREVLLTLNGVDASILKKSYINRIIKSMLHHHEHATSLTLTQLDDLDDFINWNTSTQF